ncbi:MAG: hypothetical protein GY714_21475 [Desulfobacterales bacterium]|nr:hypothetical protein [Desulfobacterales bacterium]MCP4163355.1 hypothetical protein [Deltaproteobacteria bacterium]
MKQTDRELTGIIIAKSPDDLADAVLPLLDEFYLSKGRYRYTLHDDGDHLYVEFNDENDTSAWFEDTGDNFYVLHISKDQPSIHEFNFFLALKDQLNSMGFRFRLENTPVYENDEHGKTEFIESIKSF